MVWLPLVALVALDAVGMARAWASPSERVALVLGAAALHLACIFGALVIARGTSALVPRLRPNALFLVGLPPIFVVAARLGSTHVAQRAGGAGPLVLGLFFLAAWLGVLRFVRSSPRTARDVLVPLALLIVVANACLSPRMLPPLHLVAVLAVLGLTVALLEPTTRLRTAALAASLCALVAPLALRLSSNVRFVAHEQLPGAGALLGMLATDAAPVSASTTRTPPAALDGSLADAHFVLITIDALRADALGCYGAARATPNLDALAARGLRFARAYAQAPSTALSVTSILTSTPPHALAAAPPTLPEVLRQEDWFTEAFYPDGLFFDGKDALPRYAELRFGFAWNDTRTQDARGVTDTVLARLDALAVDGEPRAFLWAHYFDPHEPYEAHPGLTRGDDARARYEGEVAYVDAELGRLFAGLARLRRPVIVVVTADHGEELGEHGAYYHGSSVYEEQVRVPLLLAARGVGPDVIDGPVELVDVLPTVTSLLGVRMAGSGRDLLAPADGRPHDAHASVHTKRMLVRGKYKLIHDIHRDFDELYDLDEDPGERHNVFDHRPEVAAPLHAALERAFALVDPQALVATLVDHAAATGQRVAAADELGARSTGEGREALARALTDPDAHVANAAALALGELRDPRAASPLVALLGHAEVALHAAILLGRGGDVRALPTLLDALEREPDVERRRAALHVIGALGDAAAARRLASHLDDLRTRSERYLALGRIASRHPAAHLEQLLLARLGEEPYDDARAHLVWALSLAATGLELPRLLTDVRENGGGIALEGVTRSRAFPSALVGGVDLGPAREAIDIGLHGCRRDDTPTIRQWSGASSCKMGERALLHLALPRPGAATLFLRARAKREGELEVWLGAEALGHVRVGPTYAESRVIVPPGLAERAAGRLLLRAVGATEVELDYALLLPDGGTPNRLARYHPTRER